MEEKECYIHARKVDRCLWSPNMQAIFDSQTDSINIRIPRKIECRQREKQSVSGLSPGMFLSWKSQLQSSRIYYLVYRKGEKKKPAKEDVVLLVFFATFLWANFAAMPMMNDCEKSARHLWLLWLMNTPTVGNPVVTTHKRYSGPSPLWQTIWAGLSIALIGQVQTPE